MLLLSLCQFVLLVCKDACTCIHNLAYTIRLLAWDQEGVNTLRAELAILCVDKPELNHFDLDPIQIFCVVKIGLKAPIILFTELFVSQVAN